MRYDYRTLETEPVGSQNQPGYRPSLNKSFGRLSGSAGATWSLSERLLLRGNVAAAFRSPNLAELTSNGPHELRYEIGDPQLKPENSLETDFSLHYHHKNFTIDLAVFNNQVNNFIYIAPTGDTTSDGMSIYRYQQDDSQLYGAEAGIHIHPSTARWLHLQSTFASVIGKKKNGESLPFIPAHKLTFEIKGEKEQFLFLHQAFASVYTTVTFAQNRPAADETPTNGYTLSDLKLGGTLKIAGQPFSIILAVNNLFDVKYVDHVSMLKEVNFFNPGRNIAISLRIPFCG